MKNIGQYNQDLSVPRKKDIDSLEARVKTNEDNIAMAESDIEGLNIDVSTLKTDVSNVKTALSSKQDTIVGAASTIVEDNLTKNKILVADDNGKVSASEYISDDGGLLNVNGQIQILDDMTIYSEDQTEAIGLTADGTDNIRLVASDSGSTGPIECFFYPSSNKILFRHSNDNVTLTGIADATSDNDAVNLGQLNEVKKSIPSSSDFVKTSGGMVTGPLYLLGGTGALNVKNGSITLNEGYSIGYSDGNYNFTQISGNFQISKGGSGQGVYIASGTNGTNGTLSMYVNNDSQNAATHMNIVSNGVISLSAEDSSSGSFIVNNVRITGVANGTANNDAVNVSQLNAIKNSIPDKSSFLPKGPVMVIIRNVTLGAAHEVIHNNLWDCTFLGTIYGTRYIDGVEVQIYPQSHIVSVGGSDYSNAGGFCAVQKSANSMEVVIKALCTSSAAPSSIQIPCLVW